jgi:hypothetical protein
MKVFSVTSAMCLIVLASTCAVAQTNRENPKEGQATYGP